jgi:16S rRNA (cytosine1402-N4)-methyltransferase
MHIPVLVKELIEFLMIKPEGIYIDATVGCGGHSEEILKKLNESGKVIGIDLDREVLEIAKERLKNYKNFIPVKDNYKNLKNILEKYGIEKVDGVFFDLGFCKCQILWEKRGFSFLKEGPLDMRYDRESNLTAHYVVNNYSEEELSRIIKEYSEERYAKKIAHKIVLRRKKKKINTTTELAEIVKVVYPKKRFRIHPATRTFQALRIFVNDELNNLKKGLEEATNSLKKGGRIAVISFHSLEDRIVKNFFKENSSLKIVNKKVITPAEIEKKLNPDSSSAKLRVAEKI